MLQNANTILIIDQDEEDCQFFREALAEVAPGIEVICLDGEEALWADPESVRPFLIFAAYRSSGTGSIEWVEQLANHPVYGSVPVVLWSTGCLEPCQKAAYGAGVRMYMEKPWEMELWNDRVRSVLAQFPRLSSGFKKVDLSCRASRVPALQVA
ncbi:hypothetical protein V9K67_00260 [Paraflavisolibacter sp. H34]|uniref:response regulator n=1 Tax=Huijunlia imazamoxiresistens TaxID=3127457 RepID=UPI003018FB46